MFTFAISCLITSNLPWFMDLTFQVPVQYCSLQHQTLLPSLVTSTTGCCFCFDSVSSFFLELFLHSSTNSILGTYWPGEVIFQCPIFLSFHTVQGALKARILKWFSIPFSIGPCFVRTLCHDHLSWVALQGMANSFLSYTRLWFMWSVWLAFYDCAFHSFCPIMDKDKRLMEASWWERLTEGENESCSDGWGHVQ